MSVFKKFWNAITGLFLRIKVFLLFQFKLKPKINKMIVYISRIANLKQDAFPEGKSLFVFPGKDDTLYFVILKESNDIRVMEVFDDVLNILPKHYQILNRVKLHDLIIN